jgi:excisionase family DNA binding protein
MSEPIPSPSLDCLTPAQFARCLKYSARKMDRLIAEKKVTHIKDGRSVRIPVQAAMDFELTRTVRCVRPAGAGPERLAPEDIELLAQRIASLIRVGQSPKSEMEEAA